MSEVIDDVAFPTLHSGSSRWRATAHGLTNSRVLRAGVVYLAPYDNVDAAQCSVRLVDGDGNRLGPWTFRPTVSFPHPYVERVP